MRDHPRVGGEKPFLFYGGSSDSGSPPHGRGKGHRAGRSHHRAGITPAWAGKSQLRHARRDQAGDHPRVGGEKAERRQQVSIRAESPPRGRGKDLLLFYRLFAQRITPARAGKRPQCSCRAAAGKDHPRVGGEKMEIMLDVWTYQGSPPRRRGKAELVIVRGIAAGITPAWAGKSSTMGVYSVPA